ncbi:von Willebrand factor A domain-containing protein 2 [Erpetoichthys calabaricus]|uniref:von Willebrand factor A domain containing 2 n=1 Tax=Erpetoichthys calabaricus TaxID=27687 RepID=A0A8C4RP55_ERPCA|nr:von Willebrand factor A domain-containing protein 2 [Erpetoichthys calabaricus]
MTLIPKLAVLSTVMLFKVFLSESLLELQVDNETTVKISAAGELMQCSASIDVLLLLDGSYSIGKGSFERSKHFAVKLCEALDISPERVRVGIIQYSSSPRLEFSLDASPTKEEVKERIKKVAFMGGSTQTGLALKYVMRKGFLGGRNSTVPKILIIFSDGKSQGPVQIPADHLKEKGITIFAVGIKYPRWEELHTLASKPSDQHVLFAERFDDAVNGLYTTLTSSTVCSAIPPGCKIESRPCERKTLETVKEFKGNFMCWKGSQGKTSPYTSLCPYYSWNRVYRKHQSTCYRTICPDPCDSQPCHNGGTCIPEGLEKYRCVCPVGFGGNSNCVLKMSLACSVDILFLIESSSSVTLEGFLRFKSFLKRFIQSALSSDSPVNVGLAQYSDSVQIEMKIGEYRNISELLQAADSMSFIGGETKTGKALRYVTQFGFKSNPVFADVQDDLPRVVVLLTDSKSQDSVSDAAKYARDREYFLIALGGVFLKADLNEITGNPQRTITYSSPQDLFNKLPELGSKICSVDSQGCLGQPLDLVFGLDASAGVGKDNFVRLRDFVKSTSVQFDINRDVTQIGLVTYSSHPHTVFALDTYESGSSVLQAISQVTYLGGSVSTGSALLHIHDDVMTVQKGARPGVNKVVVVITDGAGGEDAVVPAQKIRNNGIGLIVIGIGDAQKDTLVKIAGSEKYLIPVPSYEDLKYFEDLIVQKVCEEAKRPINLCRPNPCMNDGICILLRGSYRCECRGWDGPHCEYRNTRTTGRGDLPRPSGLLTNRRRQRKHSGLHHLKKVRLRKRNGSVKY